MPSEGFSVQGASAKWSSATLFVDTVTWSFVSATKASITANAFYPGARLFLSKPLKEETRSEMRPTGHAGFVWDQIELHVAANGDALALPAPSLALFYARMHYLLQELVDLRKDAGIWINEMLAVAIPDGASG